MTVITSLSDRIPKNHVEFLLYKDPQELLFSDLIRDSKGKPLSPTGSKLSVLAQVDLAEDPDSLLLIVRSPERCSIANLRPVKVVDTLCHFQSSFNCSAFRGPW